MPPVKQVVDEKEWGAFDSNDAVQTDKKDETEEDEDWGDFAEASVPLVAEISSAKAVEIESLEDLVFPQENYKTEEKPVIPAPTVVVTNIEDLLGLLMSNPQPTVGPTA